MLRGKFMVLEETKVIKTRHETKRFYNPTDPIAVCSEYRNARKIYDRCVKEGKNVLLVTSKLVDRRRTRLQKLFNQYTNSPIEASEAGYELIRSNNDGVDGSYLLTVVFNDPNCGKKIIENREVSDIVSGYLNKFYIEGYLIHNSTTGIDTIVPHGSCEPLKKEFYVTYVDHR